MDKSYNRDELYALLDAIVCKAHNSITKDYIREQTIIALVARGKSRDKTKEWLLHCELNKMMN